MTKWQLLGTACRNNNNKQKQKKNWAACIDDLCMWCVCSETRKYENNLRLSFSFCRSFRSHPDSHLNKCWLFYDNHSHCHFYIFVRLFCRAVFRAFSLSRSMYTRGCLCVIFLYHLPITAAYKPNVNSTTCCVLYFQRWAACRCRKNYSSPPNAKSSNVYAFLTLHFLAAIVVDTYPMASAAVIGICSGFHLNLHKKRIYLSIENDARRACCFVLWSAKENLLAPLTISKRNNGTDSPCNIFE